MITHYIFNGDADGICSAVQLYRDNPCPKAAIITGPKREIELVGRANAGKGDYLAALDISMRSNMSALTRALSGGANVLYIDHHNAGEIPNHAGLTAIIDTSAQMCTAALTDMCVGGAYRAWAVTAAYGDNFPKLAQHLALGHNLPLERLARFGMLLNYNGYGEALTDLHFDPAELFLRLRAFDTPMQALAAAPDIFDRLERGYEADYAFARAAEVIDDSACGLILALPAAPASRRISGVYGNDLAQNDPGKAHAVLTVVEGGYLVSVRAPLSRQSGADRLCLQFETGGGRAAAAGINLLPDHELPRFIQAFQQIFAA